MANHGEVGTSEYLTTERLYDLLREINQERFGGVLEVTRDEDDECVVAAGHPFWLTSKHRIEMRHGCHGEIDWWIHSAFINDLAFKLNGTIRDDGCDGEWRGVQNKYPTFLSYVEAHFPRTSEEELPFKVYLTYEGAIELLDDEALRPFLGGPPPKPEGFDEWWEEKQRKLAKSMEKWDKHFEKSKSK